MKTESEKFEELEVFKSDEKFRRLRKGTTIVVGDKPDARRSRLLYKSRVRCNWPSQWESRFPGGYIGLENGENFDLARHSIDGQEVYIFRYSEAIDLLWRRQCAERQILNWSETCAPADLIAAAQLVVDATRLGVKSWLFFPLGSVFLSREAKRLIATYLSALSVRDLEDLAALFALDYSAARTEEKSAA